MIAMNYHYIVTVGDTTRQFETATDAADFYTIQAKQGRDPKMKRCHGSLPQYEPKKPKGDAQ